MTVLDRHIAAVNGVVAGGDADQLAAGLTPDCTMIFLGIPVGPFEGREAVVAAYRTNPPDDQVVVLDSQFGEDRIEATYAWATEPGRPAGRVILELDGDLVKTWTVDYWT
jgi:steroid Delta-isomerase